MKIVEKIKNLFGMKEEDKDLLTLLSEGNIEKAKGKFTNRQDKVKEALSQWNIEGHKIMERPDKSLLKGDIVESWNIPFPYQKKIVQSAVAFLYGKPIKLKQESVGTDKAFKALTDLRKDMRMAAKDQKCAEIMKSETECVKLFIPYKDPKDPTNFNSVKCILLAKSLGDIIHVSFDNYGVLKAVGREYKIQVGNKSIQHFDVYMADFTYYCELNGSWSVSDEINLIGKIAMVWYMQPDPEWAVVQKIIDRREYSTSARADNIDRTGDPILLLEGEVLSLPGAKEVGKVVRMKPGGKASYLVPQMSIDMVKNEQEDLERAILYFTDTVDLHTKDGASLGQDSGKALQMKYFGPILKAMSQHGYYEEMHDRENEILKAFISKVIDPSSSMESEIKNLLISIEFGNPLPDNIDDTINTLNLAVGGKPIMSQKTAVELNPLVKDADAENKLIKNESLGEITD